MNCFVFILISEQIQVAYLQNTNEAWYLVVKYTRACAYWDFVLQWFCWLWFRHEFISWSERWMYNYCERVMSFWNGFWLVVDLACQRHVCCQIHFVKVSVTSLAKYLWYNWFYFEKIEKVPCTVWMETEVDSVWIQMYCY